jgi:hypothetical protein
MSRMLPFKVKPFQAFCYLALMLLTFSFGGCDGCVGCDEDGCPWTNDAGCECRVDDNDVLNKCEPGGCDFFKDLASESYKYDIVDLCTGETKAEACKRLNGSAGSGNVTCAGTITDKAPSMDVTVAPNLSNYPVGQSISLKAVAKDVNQDIVELRFEFDNGGGPKSVYPTTGRGTKFTTYPVVQTESFTPTEPGCYRVSVVAQDGRGNTSAGGTKDLNVGGTNFCSGGGGELRRETRFIAPSGNGIFPAEYPVQLTVSVRARVGDEVEKVEFYLGTTLLSSQSVGKYQGMAEFKWTPALTDVGEHDLSAKAVYKSQETPGSASVKVRITKGADQLTQPSLTLPPVTTVGRMFSARIFIPLTGSGLPIDDAAIRMGSRYCKLLSTSGPACPMYSSESAIFSQAELDKPDAINDADFLIIKDNDGRTFTIYGLATPEEFIAYQKGEANLTLELEGFWSYQMKLVSTDPEKAAKDASFNQMIDFTLDILSRPDPERPVTVTALGKRSAMDFTPRSIQYLTMMCLSPLYQASTKGYKAVDGALIVLTAAHLNLVVGYGRGIFEGLWGGLRDDYQGLKELATFLWSPIDRGAEMFFAMKEVMDEISTKGFEQFNNKIFEAITNVMTDFLETADKSVAWRIDGSGLAIEVGIRAYIAGYVSGYLTEQVAAFVTGAGAAAKAGKMVALVMRTTKAGRVAMEGLTAANKFKKKLWHFSSRQLQKAKDLTGISAVKAKLEDIRKVIVEFADEAPGLAYAKELGEGYQLWRDKLEALAVASANDWLGSARTTLIRLVDINRMDPGNKLSDPGVGGFFGIYPKVADLEALDPTFVEWINSHWVVNSPTKVVSRLDQVFVEALKSLPAVVKSPGTGGLGKKFKMRGVRTYHYDPVNDNPFAVYHAGNYRFNAPESRPDSYFSEDFPTSFGELREYVFGKRILIADFEADNILDLSDPAVASSFRVNGAALDMNLLKTRIEDKKFPNKAEGMRVVYGYGQTVADAAIAQGYKGIYYPSAQVAGKHNIVLFGGTYNNSIFTPVADVPVP